LLGRQEYTAAGEPPKTGIPGSRASSGPALALVQFTCPGAVLIAGRQNLLQAQNDPGNRSETYKLPKYIVRGHVQDEKGNPIGGAAIRIGQEIVYTNADGDFFVRQKKPGVLAFEVALPEFLNEATFEVVSAPATAVAAPDATAPDLLVVLGPASTNKPR